MPVKYEIRQTSMCGILPCTKVVTNVRMDSKIKTVFEEIEKPACCPGYAETPDRRCAPICLIPCKNGKCVQPNVCQCYQDPTETKPGFVGSSCDRFVCQDPNRWGSRCERECSKECSATSYCSASTGSCVCRPGWRGANCSEECEPGMIGCEGMELPPIMEPDANVLNSEVISSQRLVASNPRSMSADSITQVSDDESSTSSSGFAHLIAAHMSLNLFLTLVTLTLLATIFLTKKRLNRLKNEIYYGPYSTSSNSGSSGGNSDYSRNVTTLDSASNMQNRPRMLTPMESDFLGKNLDFAAATRSILSKDTLSNSNKSSNDRDKFLLDAKLESHLMSSQKSSQQNIYSDIESNLTDRSYCVIQTTIPEDKMLDLNSTNSSNNMGEESAYQVPKTRADLSISFDSSANDSRPEVNPLICDREETIYDDLNNYSNLYEEIKPNSPKKR